MSREITPRGWLAAVASVDDRPAVRDQARAVLAELDRLQAERDQALTDVGRAAAMGQMEADRLRADLDRARFEMSRVPDRLRAAWQDGYTEGAGS